MEVLSAGLVVAARRDASLICSRGRFNLLSQNVSCHSTYEIMIEFRALTC